MSIVITTPTGNIGRHLVQQLLDAGEPVTLVARDPSKVKDFVDRGAKVVEGSHVDAAVLTKATQGADALFVLTPPDFSLTDIRAHYRRFGEAAASAIKANSIPYVVHLSSVGADLQEGTGPVVGLYENEQILNGVRANVAHLRSAYFMENTLGQIPAILQAGALFTTLISDTKFPMIATRDIAKRAAELLTSRGWTGSRVIELQGPEVFSYGQAAACLSEVLGRPLNHVTVTEEQQRETLMGMGASQVIADSFHELSMALNEGKVRFHEPRSEANTTTTTFPQFAQEVYRPAFEAASKG